METIVFNSIQVTNYWFTLHCALRPLYQQAQTSSSNIWGISDQDVTLSSFRLSALVVLTMLFTVTEYMNIFSFCLSLSFNFCFTQHQHQLNCLTVTISLQHCWPLILVISQLHSFVSAVFNAVKSLSLCLTMNVKWWRMFNVTSVSRTIRPATAYVRHWQNTVFD